MFGFCLLFICLLFVWRGVGGGGGGSLALHILSGNYGNTAHLEQMLESVIFIKNTSPLCPFIGRGNRDVIEISKQMNTQSIQISFLRKGYLTLLERNRSSVLNKIWKDQIQNIVRKKPCLSEMWSLNRCYSSVL